MEGWK